MSQCESQWIVVEFLGNPVEAVIVTAATEQEAAEKGAQYLWNEALGPTVAPVHGPSSANGKAGNEQRTDTTGAGAARAKQQRHGLCEVRRT